MKNHVFYDYDGTLGDSLPGHMKFLYDMNQRFKTGLKLPSIEDYESCKALIGMPMETFLKNSGFPESLVPEIMSVYEKDFGSNPQYASSLFPGIAEMVNVVFDLGINQSIISSNFSRNISPALKKGGIESCFAYLIDRDLLKQFHSSSKEDCLRKYSKLFAECVYVGDAEGDFKAAHNAGVFFVGVSYGWQIKPRDKRFPVANTPSQLQNLLLSLCS